MESVADVDVAVIGAGAAGCSAAIVLRQRGLRVALVDCAMRSQARFCGEFVSGEALLSLDRLGVAASARGLGANPIRCFELHPAKSRPLRLPLAGGAFALTRRSLDRALLDRAVETGAAPFFGMRITGVSGSPAEGYRVRARDQDDHDHVFSARAVIGAYGKRSTVDRLLGRPLHNAHSGWIGVRRHYRGVDRGDAVGLYLFPGGYCGAVTAEGGLTTLALLAGRATLNQCGGRPDLLIARARACNPGLRWLDEARPVDDTLLTISQVSFLPKQPVVQGVFMAGDAAGVTAPFLGIGVANALGSGRACAEAVHGWLAGSFGFDRARLDYERWWRRGERVRRLSRPASWLLCRPFAGNAAVWLLNRAPFAAEAVYRASRVVEPRAGSGERASTSVDLTGRLPAPPARPTRETTG